jgi:phenylacetate-CoA ligase
VNESPSFRLYGRLPVVLQNAAFSLHGYRERRARYGGAFGSWLERLVETQWSDRDEIRRHQDANVRWVVRHAYETVPFYRALYDRHGIRPERIRGVDDLPSLPLVTKQMVRDAGATMRSGAVDGSTVRVVLTSGTSGTPLRIARSAESLAMQWAIWWRHRTRFGLRLDDPYLMVGARVPISARQRTPPFWRTDWANHRVYLSSYHLDDANMPAIVDMLERREFRYYTGYPSAIVQLCDYLLKQRIRLRRPPQIVTTGSDALLPAFEQRIRDALGCPVTDQYGMAEFAGNFARCEQGRYHLDHECCAAELLPIPGASCANLVFTGWGNPAMPFIRYVVGDHAVAAPPLDRCPCGRASPTVRAIDGRLEDYVYTPDGRQLIGLNQVFEYAVGAREIQVVQPSPTEIEVRIAPGPDYDARATVAALTRELTRRLGHVDVQIRFVLVDHIAREANGKFRAVLSAVRDTSFSGRTLRDALATPMDVAPGGSAAVSAPREPDGGSTAAA